MHHWNHVYLRCHEVYEIQVLENDLHGTQGFLVGLQDVKGSAHILEDGGLTSGNMIV